MNIKEVRTIYFLRISFTENFKSKYFICDRKGFWVEYYRDGQTFYD